MAKNSGILNIAKNLRLNMTDAEKLLWEKVRNKQLGVKFRRQMPFIFGVYKFIVDFYCPKYKLIIEIDGGIHNKKSIREIDDFRASIFIQNGYQILRFTNNEIKTDIKNVISKIENIIT